MAYFDNILDFWFHDIADEISIDKNKPPASLWFNGGRKFDDEIREKFLADYQKAKAGEYKDWESSPRGTLALVILFDQFPRNMFRNTPQAFETDALALDVVSRSVYEGVDKDLALVERVFFYMPYMHAESLGFQEEGIRAFKSLVEESKQKASHNTSYFEYNLSYAERHRDLIVQFGRFPHRNAVLNRPLTEEEAVFLGKPASSF